MNSALVIAWCLRLQDMQRPHASSRSVGGGGATRGRGQRDGPAREGGGALAPEQGLTAAAASAGAEQQRRNIYNYDVQFMYLRRLSAQSGATLQHALAMRKGKVGRENLRLLSMFTLCTCQKLTPIFTDKRVQVELLTGNQHSAASSGYQI